MSAWGAALLPSCLPRPAWPRDRGSCQPGSSPLILVALYPGKGSILYRLWRAALLQRLHPGVGSSILHWRPTGALGILFCSKDVEIFQQLCSHLLAVYFEKYPASVEHLSVKGEEIYTPLPPYFLAIVLAWRGFGYYGFVK